MNIRCPRCNTLYRVDPERVPAGGVRAKCFRCEEVFPVARPVDATPEAVMAVAPTSVAPETVPAASAPTQAAPDANEVASAQEAAAPVRPPVVEAAPSPVKEALPVSMPASSPVEDPGAPPAKPAASAPAAPKIPAFGPQDPHARAKRLARALVSDIVAYFPERRDKSLAEGTLKTEFREEILKSWEEFVLQVGSDVARDTPYFQDALNEILAKGQTVF